MPSATPWAMRWVIARVLPVPAPARTRTGPRRASATWRCSGSSAPSRSGSDTAWNNSWGRMVEGDITVDVGRDSQRMSGSVTMYTTPWCGYCHRLKGQMDREGITVDLVDIEQQPEAAAVVERVING